MDGVQIIDFDSNKKFNAILKAEVDKANKRLSRMNEFQRNLFEDKGITKISRAGSRADKLRALSQARIVNESGISTRKEYNDLVRNLASDLSMNKKAVEYMLNSIDFNARDFISGSSLKRDSDPKIDFLFEDTMAIGDLLQDRLDNIRINATTDNELANEILDIVYGK